MKNIFQKSAMALAVASLSVSAFAGTLTGADEVVLANEVFGAGSEATLVAAPQTVFNIDAARGAIDDGEEATVKFTLNQTAVFGENLSLIDNWAASNATLVFTYNSGATVTVAGSPYVPHADFPVVVDQGGEVDDNTVTFKITNNSGADDRLVSVTVAQYRTKNLTTPLHRGSSNPSVKLGAEFRNVDTGVTDTADARVIFRSQNGVKLTGIPTDYVSADGAVTARARINVAASEMLFTSATGIAAAKDFDAEHDTRFVTLGTLAVERTEALIAQGNNPLAGSGDLVQKENGDEFDFNGDDEIDITISSTSTLDAFSGIYLTTGACNATVPTSPMSKAPAAGADSVVLSLKGQTTLELGTGYTLCAVAKENTVIPEQAFTANLNVGYFNPRYTDSVDTLEYNQILRNGCSVTLFNLPTTSVGDDAYIRLTNVSELDGAVRGYVWTEGGERLDLGSELTDSLVAHGTVVLHTNEGQGNGVFLGDVLPEYSELTSGRHRIVLQGAFPACEAMGLIRTPAGVLVNMTSTTYSGDQSRLGEFNNGTSNTSN